MKIRSFVNNFIKNQILHIEKVSFITVCTVGLAQKHQKLKCKGIEFSHIASDNPHMGSTAQNITSKFLFDVGFLSTVLIVWVYRYAP